MIPTTPEQLEARRATMLTSLAGWREPIDPCSHGHVDHTAEAHQGRLLVHSISAHGFGADWDMADAVDFIKTATDISGYIDALRAQTRHINVRGADGRVMAFECAPTKLESAT